MIAMPDAPIADPVPVSPSPRRKRRFAIVLGAVGLLLLVLVLLLPACLSTGPGTRLAISVANGYVNGSIALDDLSVGWFSATRVRGLVITGDDGQPIVSVGELALPDKSLLGLLGATSDLGRITGDAIDLRLVRYDDGTTNLQRLAKSSGSAPRDAAATKRSGSTASSDYRADVQLTNVSVALTAPDIEPVMLTAPKVRAQLDGLRQLDLDIDATITQGLHAGTITATGGISDLAGPAPRADLAAQLTAIPVAAVDQLLGYDGKLAALLGAQLDARLSVTGSRQDADIRLIAKSPQLAADLPLHVSNDALTSAGDASVRLTVTPRGYAAWAASASGGGELREPVTFTVNLTDLQVPMRDSSPVANEIRAAFVLHADALRLHHASVGDVALTSLEGGVQLDLAVGSIDAKLAGPFTLNDQPGTLNLDATVAGLGSDEGLTLDAALTDLPVPIVDQLAQQDGRLVALMGQRLTFTAKGAYPGDLDLALRSDHATLDAPLSITAETYTLRAPAKAEIALQPAAYPLITGEKGGTLAQPATITLTVNDLNVPIKNGSPDLAQLRTDATLTATPLLLDVPDVGRVRLDALRGTLAADQAANTARLALHSPLSIDGRVGTLDVAGVVSGLRSPVRTIDVTMTDLPIPILDSLAGQGGRATALVGRTATLTAKGDYPGDLGVVASSERLEMQAMLSLTDKSYIVHKRTAARLELTPAAYASLVGEASGTLAQPATVTIEVMGAQLPLRGGKPDLLQLTANVALRTSLFVVDVPQVGRVQLDAIQGSAQLDRNADTATLTLVSPLSINGEAGRLDARAHIEGLAAATRRLDVKFTDVPIAIADQLAQQQGKITAVIGPKANLTAVGSYPGDLTVNVASADAQLDAPLAFTEQSWSLRSPGKLHLKLDPADYALLVGAEAGSLKAPLVLDAEVKTFFVPLADAKPDWTKLKASLDAKTNTVTITVPEVGDMTLDGLVAAVATDRATDTAQVAVKSPINIAGTPGTQTPGTQGNLDVALTLKSTADGPPYEIAGSIADLPMPLIDHLAKLNGDATALVGPVASAKVQGTFPGALQFDMTSRSVNAVAPLNISEDRVVTLTRDLTVHVSLQDEGTRRIMARAHPIIADAVASEQPIKLLVRAEGFELPTSEFTFDKLRAKGVLNLGTLRMTRKGWFDTFLSKALSRLSLGGLVEAETYTATFTPMNFVVVNGQVRTSEVWMTTDEMAVGFQGRADVPADAYDFQLGIMGSTLLSKVRKIPGAEKYADFMPPADIITVPLSGRLNAPVPQLVPIATEIVKYVAQSQGSAIDPRIGQMTEQVGGVLSGIFGRGDSKPAASGAVSWSPPSQALTVAESMLPKPEPKPQPKPRKHAEPAAGEADKPAEAQADPATESAARREAAGEAAARQRAESEQRRAQAEKEAAQQRKEAADRRTEAERRAAAQREAAEQKRKEQQEQPAQRRKETAERAGE